MEESNGTIEELSGDLSRYIETRIEHAKLTGISTGIELSAQTLGAILLVLLFLIGYFCFICGLAFFLGAKLGGTSMGFLMLSGIHLLLFIIVLVLRNTLIIHPFREKMIKLFFKK